MKRNKRLGKISVLLLFLCLASLCHAENKAIVLNVSGRAVCEFTVEQEDKTIVKKTKEVAIADILSEGDKITLESDCILKMNYFSTGVQEELAGNGTITVGEKGSQQVKGNLSIKNQKVFSFGERKVPIRKEDLQKFGVDMLRGDEDAAKTGSEIRILRPADTAVRNNTPEFKWKAVKDVKKYVLDINDRRIITDLLYYNADSSIGLEPGKSYLWSVSAENKGAATLYRFKILSEKEAGEVAQWESDLRKKHAENSPELLLSQTLLYQKYSLNDDAADMLSRLSEKYPDNENFIKWRHLLPGYSSP